MTTPDDLEEELTVRITIARTGDHPAAELRAALEPMVEVLVGDVLHPLYVTAERRPRPLGVIVEARVMGPGTKALPLRSARRGVCPLCQEVTHDADCDLVGDGRPTETTP